MIRNRSALLAGGLLLVGQLAVSANAAAQPAIPFYRLVDTAAQRLATADQVLGSVAADATAHGIEPGYVRAIFTDQIAATEGIEYTRFGQWKFDPATAPSTAPDLSESRTQIDGFNKTLVEEIALQWNSLHSAGCGQDLSDATAAVANDRHLDPLYQQALSAATRSYCETT